jgi:Flp pilus assembly protein protease CpaA
VEDTGGCSVTVTGDVLTVIPLDLRSRGHSTLVNEALTEYHWEDGVTYGIAEYLHQVG